MKAQFINEKFTEGSDPIIDMGVGLKNNPKVLLPWLVKELKKYDIEAEINKSFEFGDGHYEINIQGDENAVDYDEDKSMDVQYFYSTTAAAREEGWKGGFSLANDYGSNICKVSHDPMVSIKVLIKRKYGTKVKIAKRIKTVEKQLQTLKEIETWL